MMQRQFGLCMLFAATFDATSAAENYLDLFYYSRALSGL